MAELSPENRQAPDSPAVYLRDALQAIEACRVHYATQRKEGNAPWLAPSPDIQSAGAIPPAPIIDALLTFATPSVNFPERCANPKIRPEFFVEDLALVVRAVQNGAYQANPYLYEPSADSFVDIAAHYLQLLSVASRVPIFKEAATSAGRPSAVAETTPGKPGGSPAPLSSANRDALTDLVFASALETIDFLEQAAFVPEGEPESCYWSATKYFEKRTTRAPVYFGHTFFSAVVLDGLVAFRDQFDWATVKVDTQNRVETLISKGIHGLARLRREDGLYCENITRRAADIPSTVFALQGILADWAQVENVYEREGAIKSIVQVAATIGADLDGLPSFDRDLQFPYLSESPEAPGRVTPTVMDDRSTIGNLLRVLSIGLKVLPPEERTPQYYATLDALASRLVQGRGEGAAWREIWYSASAVEAMSVYARHRIELEASFTVRDLALAFSEVLKHPAVQAAIADRLVDLVRGKTRAVNRATADEGQS